MKKFFQYTRERYGDLTEVFQYITGIAQTLSLVLRPYACQYAKEQY